MNEAINIVSAWTRQIERGQRPSSADLRDHLDTVHDKNAGFTEACAWNCRDTNGKNSYEFLADIIDKNFHSNVLDLGCGSGVLLDLCNQRFGTELALSGVDMSNAELQLARKRLAHTNIKLHQGMAQDLHFINDETIDVILCHWALTLMDPVVPVFSTIKRILKKGGIFAAVIDGDAETAPGYLEIRNIIYKYVQREYPDYGAIELGDPKVRTTIGLSELAAKFHTDSDIDITPVLYSLSGSPDTLAHEAAGFFYASFVLSSATHSQMLIDLENYFTTHLHNGISYYNMPVNHLVIRKN
jgi:ubiquinone/menaquinone biosynthesis C-methylase UbiE